MHGNNRIPGYAGGSPRRHLGSMWIGYPESTWFRVRVVKNESADKKLTLKAGAILRMDVSDGTFVPFKYEGISTALALAIVADDNVDIKSGENGSAIPTSFFSAERPEMLSSRTRMSRRG